MKRAIYALSADPITFGHIDVILRAAEMFDELIIGIGNNPSKVYTLTKQERYKITQNVFSKYKNISVEYFEGALVDFSYKVDANIIVRGLRNINDFNDEQILAAINKSLKPNLETCFILSEPNKTHVSSSSSKALVREFFDSSQYLPFSSKKALEFRINNQIFIGITGLMGTGKSYISEQLSGIIGDLEDNEKIHNVDLDYLCHEVYNEDNNEYKTTREDILEEFGTLERKRIGQIVFNDDLKMKKLNDLFREPLKILIRNHCRHMEGIILINGATLISENFLNLVNNHVIIVNAREDIRYKRCSDGRSIDKEILIERDKKMLSFEEQVEIVKNKINNDSYGELIIIDNNETMTINNKQTSFEEITNKLLSFQEI